MSWRTIFGKWPAGTPGSGYGLKIAFPGVNANAASDAQLMFSSDWAGTLSILQTGVIGIASPNSVTIGFADQGFVPAACFMADPISGATDGMPGPTPTVLLCNGTNHASKGFLTLQMAQTSFTAGYGGFGSTGLAQEPGYATTINLYYCIFRLPLG